jgi:hypothetical protein
VVYLVNPVVVAVIAVGTATGVAAVVLIPKEVEAVQAALYQLEQE